MTVVGDLKVGSINNIPWSSFIDRSSTTLVTAHFTFLAASVLEAVVCDDLNGLDLSEDVVLTDTNDVIEGERTLSFTVLLQVPPK